MISYDEALELVRQSAWSGSEEALPLGESNGRRLASPILAAVDSPAFDNSAMDGYAVGSLKGPWTVVGMVAAGVVPPQIEAGRAVRIFTGAMIPTGTAAVVPQEDCELEGPTLKVGGPIKPGAHIRRQGEEFRAGSSLFDARARLTPPLISSLAAQGLHKIGVRSLPRVGLLCTGSELVPPGQPVPPGCIYESNGPAVKSLLEAHGCKVARATVRDALEETQSAASDLLKDSDLLISIGGVSVGDFDFIRPAMESLEFQTRFAGVRMKPGKPVAFAERSDGKAWFALPGNPMSALTTFCLFVLPYLGEELAFRLANLGENLNRKAGREEFYPAGFSGMGAHLQPTVGSHATHGLASATGLVRISSEVSQLNAGTPVLYADLPWRCS